MSGNRRPRVKSNIRAIKRNYWSQNRGGNDNNDNGKPNGFRARKFRRGRKQRVQNGPQQNGLASNDDSERRKKLRQRKPVAFTAFNNDFDVDTTNTDDFLPTVHTTAAFNDFEETTTQVPVTDKESEEAEIFEELFESNNDLIVASSTVSSVVFKGTPTPGPFGFFSSPSSVFDSGNGVFIGSPRPQFNNIGNQIDLGPKKFFSGNSVFVTSTESNKIFIGRQDSNEDDNKPEITAPTVEENKRQFPSFPSRGKLGALSFPFRPKPFGATTSTAATSTSEQQQDNNNSFEVTPFTTAEPSPTTTATSTTTQFEPTSATRFNPFAKNRGRFNKFFNRNRQTKQPSSSVEPVTDNNNNNLNSNEEPEAFTTEEANIPTTLSSQAPIESTTKNNNRRFPFNIRQNLLNFKPFNANSRGRARTELVKETSAKTVEPQEEQRPETITETPIASVSGLLDEGSFENEEEANEIDESFEDVSEDKTAPNRFRINRPGIGKKPAGFKRFGGVKKARQPPPNANIRVEFAKANIEESEEEDDLVPRKFFVRPDGRKPRVKSNIRARLAHSGKISFQESGEETGPSAPTGFRQDEFNGEDSNSFEEQDQEFNLEKRHISSAEFNSYNAAVNSREYHTSHEEDSFQRQPTHSVLYPANNRIPKQQERHSAEQPIITSAEQQLIASQENNNNVPVPFILTLNPRPSRQQELLEQMVVESSVEQKNSHSSSSSGVSLPSSGVSSPSGAVAPAFRISNLPQQQLATSQAVGPSVAATGNHLIEFLFSIKIYRKSSCFTLFSNF